MSSSQSLRDFIRERLTAAADEILTEFDKTIVHYEEELDRQRRLLEICWKPQIKLQRIDFLQQNVWSNDEVLTDLEFCNQKRDFMLDHREPELQLTKENEGGLQPQVSINNHEEQESHQIKSQHGEPELQLTKGVKPLLLIKNHEEQEPHQNKSQQNEPEPLLMKEEQVEPEPHQAKDERLELDISLKEKQLELQLETDSSTVNPSAEGRDIREPEPNMDQPLSLISSEPEKQNEGGINHEDPESNGAEEQKHNDRLQKTEYNSERQESPEVKRQNKTNINKFSPCKLCGKTLKRNSLNRHMMTHTGEKPFSCITCGKSFTRKQTLFLHMGAHTDEKPFSCVTCGKRFSLKQTFSVHMKTHTDEKPFSCLTCGKCFRRKWNFFEHMKIHTVERPFLCITCGKSFKRKENLTDHMKVHTVEKPFSCITCGRTFNRRRDLTEHVKIHTGEKPYSCITCGKSFTRRDAVYKHKKTHKKATK